VPAQKSGPGIEEATREHGGVPDVLGPFLGRAAAAVKALTEQAQPFDEALLDDLALENQLLDRARYLKPWPLPPTCQRAVSAAQTPVAAIAQEVVGIN
jgi:hypothetical protein